MSRKPGNRCPPRILDAILRTKRTAEGCAWGHTLDNFFCAKPPASASGTAGKEEEYSWTDVWTTSVLHGPADEGSISREPAMRARKPWPVLKIPRRGGDSVPALGDVDPGSDHENDGPDSALSTGELAPCYERGELATRDADPFQIDTFPKLEEFVPPEYLPDALCVHDPDHRVSGIEPTEDIVYYRRVFPAQNSGAGETATPERSGSRRVGHLYLTRQSRVGCGHHSNVYRASFRLPAPLETDSGGFVAVVAKVAVPRREAREHLDHEAATYQSFPSHLAQEFCGYALVPNVKYPVPVSAVVPKFFGYYVPEHGAGDIAGPSPILLLEECGSPVDPTNLSQDSKAECFSLFLRLHLSGFLQKSAFKKNILVQPGPLTVHPSQRSLETPGFRIIDFGRAVRRPPVGNQKDWLDEKESEVRDVQKVLRIPRYSMS
ncbi:hypothetical protein GGX14DRAFT_472515 [Mycena pura]|uniref:Protein kinase domain-containing protein n=1 Tax=Mycena pura TaxID=153505 RepID=A0AAD6UX55_9AGAR|nr:hypothetical protein GGX14DRAFT_472515 [Mycena pura]